MQLKGVSSCWLLWMVGTCAAANSSALAALAGDHEHLTDLALLPKSSLGTPHVWHVTHALVLVLLFVKPYRRRRPASHALLLLQAARCEAASRLSTRAYQARLAS